MNIKGKWGKMDPRAQPVRELENFMNRSLEGMKTERVRHEEMWKIYAPRL